MGIFSRFEGRVEDTFEGAADRLSKSPISPVQIAKKAEKEMRRNKMVGPGRQYAPTLYTILVNENDDQRLFGYYPTLAGETETYLSAQAANEGLLMDGQPLVRFIADPDLRRGKFEVIAEHVSPLIIKQLRQEELQRYGILRPSMGRPAAPVATGAATPATPEGQARPCGTQDDFHYHDDFSNQELPYVPENEIDYSIDYGEYTFDSQDFKGGHVRGAHVNSMGAPDAALSAAPNAFGAGAVAGVAAAGAAGAVSTVDSNEVYAAPDTTVFIGGTADSQIPNQQIIKAYLVDVMTGRTYNLASTRMIIGRSSDSDITVQDLNASRTHAELRLEPQGVWTISDLGSTNGTRVNDIPIATSQTLYPGDHISIGTTVYRFETSER